MLAHHAKTHPPGVANVRHGLSDGCALRLDWAHVRALLGHAQKTLAL